MTESLVDDQRVPATQPPDCERLRDIAVLHHSRQGSSRDAEQAGEPCRVEKTWFSHC